MSDWRDNLAALAVLWRDENWDPSETAADERALAKQVLAETGDNRSAAQRLLAEALDRLDSGAHAHMAEAIVASVETKAERDDRHQRTRAESEQLLAERARERAATPSSEEETVWVRRQWNDLRRVRVRIDAVEGLHRDDLSGGTQTRAPRNFIHGYVCLEGDVAHSCTHEAPPHSIKVCVVQNDQRAQHVRARTRDGGGAVSLTHSESQRARSPAVCSHPIGVSRTCGARKDERQPRSCED